MQTFDENVNIIQALDDLPNAVGGLTADQLKAKFDEAGNKIKTYINETLIPALNSTESASGAKEIGISAIVGLTGATNVQDALALLLSIYEAGTVTDGSVTTAKLANNAVTTAKIDDGAVDTTQLANGAVTGAKTDFSSGLALGDATFNGTMILGANDYGDNLPATPTAGRLFFKRVQ